MTTKTGKLFKKLDVQTGVGKQSQKPWSKMTFVIDVTSDPKYPKYVAFDTFKGNIIEFIQDTDIGTPIDVEYDVESREWQGRWFSNVNASRVEVIRDNGNTVINTGDHNGVNQANQMYGQDYSSPNTNSFEPQKDDLPF